MRREYGGRIRNAHFRDPQSAPDFRDRNRSAPRRHTPSRRPHGSMDFRSFDAVNSLRPPKAARETRAIDSVKTSEKRGFHEVDGAPRQAGAADAAMRILSPQSDAEELIPRFASSESDPHADIGEPAEHAIGHPAREILDLARSAFDILADRSEMPRLAVRGRGSGLRRRRQVGHYDLGRRGTRLRNRRCGHGALRRWPLRRLARGLAGRLGACTRRLRLIRARHGCGGRQMRNCGRFLKGGNSRLVVGTQSCRGFGDDARVQLRARRRR